MMTTSETLLIVDDHADVTEILARMLVTEGRTIITARDCESAGLILERVPVALLISDVHFSSRFAFEGLNLLTEAHRISPRTKILMVSGDMSEGLSLEAERRGASGLMAKPFDVHLLREAVAALLPAREPSAEAGRIMRVPLLEDLLANEQIIPHFQPIIDLAGSDLLHHGFESLSRPQVEGVPFFDCEFLFSYAERKKKSVELDLCCLKQTLRWGAPLARTGKLFINVNPQVFNGCVALAGILVATAGKLSIPLTNVVLEITEQARLQPTAEAIRCIESVRELGVQFALDDVGMSYSHLDLMDVIKPSYLKISQHFGTRFDADTTKRKIVRNIVALATAFDCEVILEGIEELSTSGAATQMGARFGQGYYYSRPQVASTFASIGSWLEAALPEY